MKKGRDEEEEEDLKFTKRERKSGRSRAEKALVAAKTQSALTSPARSEKDHLPDHLIGASFSPLLGLRHLPIFSPTNPKEGKKTFPEGKNLRHRLWGP